MPIRRCNLRSLHLPIVMLLSTTTAVAAQPLTNRLANPTFDANLAHWSLPNGLAEWVAQDARGSNTSGAARVSTIAGPNSGHGISQCVAVVPGKRYAAGGELFVANGQSEPGRGFLNLNWHADSNCASIITGAGAVDSTTTKGQWEPLATTAVAPAGAHSATIVLAAHKDSGATLSVPFEVLADNAYFGEGGCVPDVRTLCLGKGGRFSAIIDWDDGSKQGFGRSVNVFRRDSGAFWFFQFDNLEMLIKVLNGCTITNHYWVFYSATTNVEFTLRVTDTTTGEVYLSSNPLDHVALPVLDTKAFATCP